MPKYTAPETAYWYLAAGRQEVAVLMTSLDICFRDREPRALSLGRAAGQGHPVPAFVLWKDTCLLSHTPHLPHSGRLREGRNTGVRPQMRLRCALANDYAFIDTATGHSEFFTHMSPKQTQTCLCRYDTWRLHVAETVWPCKLSQTTGMLVVYAQSYCHELAFRFLGHHTHGAGNPTDAIERHCNAGCLSAAVLRESRVPKR